MSFEMPPAPVGFFGEQGREKEREDEAGAVEERTMGQESIEPSLERVEMPGTLLAPSRRRGRPPVARTPRLVQGRVSTRTRLKMGVGTRGIFPKWAKLTQASAVSGTLTINSLIQQINSLEIWMSQYFTGEDANIKGFRIIRQRLANMITELQITVQENRKREEEAKKNPL